MPNPSRRQALVTIAAGSAAAACSGPETPVSGPLSAVEIDRLAELADTIIPATDSPGAREAGIGQMIAEDAAADDALLAQVRGLLGDFERKGLFSQDADGRIAVMTAMMNGAESEKAAFESLKSLAVDYYYRTEIGLAQELGYQGGTYLAEFPGCTHDHLTEAG
jgi:hypothetical protein